ncbi:hypothetical protein CP_0591 [Chlamydia pneumoniae AR39]|uniref:Uncharacterized protein n=1 Tax=Chlamydia pneumoniae TaxID=83558 RepID=Q9K239_CHLPN|nr:hypothetical protein CP_0591 [Chlamydia pneumoniae AR39]
MLEKLGQARVTAGSCLAKFQTETLLKSSFK